MSALPLGQEWIGLLSTPLPIADAEAWAVEPRCGAVVTFNGTVRDHAEGRDGVSLLEYEAYETRVEVGLTSLAAEMRRRWPDLGRVVMLHRIGALAVGESAVVVVVAAPHRDAAFEASRFAIDGIKATVPIWKREHWSGGAAWGLEPQHISTAGELA